MRNEYQSQKLENDFARAKNFDTAKYNTEYDKSIPVEIKWGNGLIFKGYLQRKLRKNFEVRIPKALNKYWYYPNELASVPADVMRKITPEEFAEIGEWSRGLSEADGTKHK